ncbi:MAG: aminotransferase class V-fold PLP-dependent enzyme [Ignavibacteriaceae bacterium]|nr:aminotransferase class V-fold PLP-dependent enzyme [Ignavibacteriaceae bacterium]
MTDLQQHFSKFRKNIIGIDNSFQSPYGEKKILYADWIASGRLYAPIEEKMIRDFGPWVANTHSESSVTGTFMTKSYAEAKRIIKKHVNAGEGDVLICNGSGMTGPVNKFIRILGLRLPEQFYDNILLDETMRPVVFVTHMEHHSNQTSWHETIADVVVIPPDEDGGINPDNLEIELQKYKNRRLKIGSFTAASNVTGIQTPYHQLSKIMHQNGGYCFVDFACSAPYVDINMHPKDPDERLDAIFFSPHKFLGGPGTPGVLIFTSHLYHNRIPDNPGGGTVDWTNPWGEHKFVNDIEAREDGGTPPFLQTIKAALAIKLKEEMQSKYMLQREEELVDIIVREFDNIPKLHLLADNYRHRLGALSFYIEDMHYNLAVKLLNDRFGIQSRGGCSCAGTYGHYLLHVDPSRSKRITDKIDQGDLSEKPGWVRISLHPTMTDDEVYYIADALRDTIDHADEYSADYIYKKECNEFFHKDFKGHEFAAITTMFEI